MVEKKTTKAKTTKAKTTKAKTTKAKTTKAKTRSKKESEVIDDAIVFIEDDLEIDKEKELEEKRAFLEEARSQDATD